MKNPSLMQVSVEVGRCVLPPMPYTEYSLSVHLNKELTAATTFKEVANGVVDFGTRLFLRTEKAFLEATPNCSVVITAIGEKASKLEVGRGEARVNQEGRQQLRLVSGQAPGTVLMAELQFCTSAWEIKQTKTNNSRLSNFKSHLSQKQSSCEQKDTPTSKLAPNNSLTHNPDKRDKPNDPNSTFTVIKANRSEKVLPDKSEELETSSNTVQHSTKMDENLNKSSDSDLLLHMQIKVDQLQHRAAALQQQLASYEERIRALTIQYQQEKARATHFQQQAERAEAEKQKIGELLQLLQEEKGRAVRLEESRQQLQEMLILEEEKNNISSRHIEKLTKMIESLGCQESVDFNPIEQKDEIIMLNEELENELSNKNITINQMKLQIEQLKQNIFLLETASKVKKSPIYQAHPAESKLIHEIKAAPASAKNLEGDKPKMEKRTSEKIIQPLKKGDQQMNLNKPKEGWKAKEKETTKKDINPQPVSISKKPAVPKNPREMKSPTAVKAETASSKMKVKSKPLLKIQQKTTIQSEKKGTQSSLTSMVSYETVSEAPNLMIHSRNQENQPSKLQAS